MLSVLALLIIIVKLSYVQGSIVEKENITQSIITTTTVQNRRLAEQCFSRNENTNDK